MASPPAAGTPVVGMEPWTPAMRNQFIADAVASDEKHGYRQGYQFKVYPKQERGVDQDDPRRAAVTEALAATVYKPQYKRLVISFFTLLQNKLATHPIIGNLYNQAFVLMIKGSNAHTYLNGGISDIFKISDTDIVICINPFLERMVFDHIKSQVEIAVRQAMSQYKRILDHVLFLNKPFESDMLAGVDIDGFKAAVNEAVAALDDEAYTFLSPFAGIEERNKASRHSFLITNSTGNDNSVVMVEVPHFDKCERIPLRKTPLFCSFNETIDFNRDGVSKKGKFNLYRFKMNILCCEDENDRMEKVPADLIDVSIPDKEDVELLYFWARGRSVNIFDKDCGVWVTIPDLETCIQEVKRILVEYESTDFKREKRQAKLAALVDLQLRFRNMMC
jgi:hypothetical protein